MKKLVLLIGLLYLSLVSAVPIIIEYGEGNSFSFNLLVCEDKGCFIKRDVFYQNQDIYLDYSSDVEGLTIIGKLINSTKDWSNVNIPSKLNFDEIGTYMLKVYVYKKNYTHKNISLEFGVIEKKVSDNETEILAGEEIIDDEEIEGEDEKEDLLEKFWIDKENSWIIFIVSGSLLVAIILFYLIKSIMVKFKKPEKLESLE